MDNISSSTAQQQQPQQFCLRWHNHQTSLLSTLPLLLDQSHLTDVTLSAEGKTLRAHRVVLNACSTFFSELFRTLETNFHPVIVIPGASFTTVVALLTFMYSGEVNVFEEQIPTLLTLAETLGIKGLADFQNNNTLKSPRTEASTPKECNIPSSPPTKIPSPLENFFMKSFQFYPGILSQPLNFSQSALNKTTELLNKYQQQISLIQASKDIEEQTIDEHNNNNNNNLKRSNSGERKTKDFKRIDKIAENLRATSTKPNYDVLTSKIPSINMAHTSSSLILKPPPYSSLSHHFLQPTEDSNKINEGLSSLDQQQQQQQQQKSTVTSYPSPENLSTTESILDKSLSNSQQKPNNSKLYATCFICHKQLSNQYNLRVHLETHQNVRYACNVCSHVSRSKDALRKHVSYRHPGAPSPCENEARRKRSKGMSAPPYPLIKTESTTDSRTMTPPNLTNQQSFMFLQSKYGAAAAAAAAAASAGGSQAISSISTSPAATINEPLPTLNETTMKKDQSANSD